MGRAHVPDTPSPAERVGAGERSRRGDLTNAPGNGLLALRTAALAAGLGVE